MNMTSSLRVKGDRAVRDGAELSDEVLMQAYQDGSETCLAALIRRYEGELFSYLRRLLTDAALAEDAFQNTFMLVHQKRNMYQTGRPFRPWLYAIATNHAIDVLRRNARRPHTSLDQMQAGHRSEDAGSLRDLLASPVGDPSVHAERAERRELVRSTVDALPEHLRTVVALSYYQGMKYKEIADILRIPVGTVKSRLHTAIQRLGAAWTAAGISMD